jgi:adenosylhomocysteine nucleosidase
MINILTALACEANPIIQHYRLKKMAGGLDFPVYSNDRITLIISGMGKFAAASAVGYMQAMSTSVADKVPGVATPQCWLNVGIAGHKHMDVGSALLAHKVSDAAAMHCYYPCFTFDLPCVSADVISVQQPESTYSADAAYDMEALGFCAAAARFSSFELIHCLKIISDNQFVSHEHITKYVGEELIGHQLLVIENLVNQFETLRHAIPDKHVLSEDYRFLTEHFRFTVTQKNQLKRLLQRWHVLENTSVAEHLSKYEFNNAKQILLGIESHIQSKVFNC